MVQILLVEDDPSLIDGLAYTLKKNQFSFAVARTKREALSLLRQGQYDLLLLDVALPDGTGYEVCEEIRGNGNPIPILFLTAADEEVNIIRGLDSGGDDYLTKPFKIGELCSRIRALLRRAGRKGMEEAPELRSGDVTLELCNGRARLHDKPLDLTLGEYKLLCLFIRNTGRVLARQAILDALWDQGGNFVDDNTVSVYIRRLREKVEADPSKPERLITVRGFGYQWNEVRQ